MFFSFCFFAYFLCFVFFCQFAGVCLAFEFVCFLFPEFLYLFISGLVDAQFFDVFPMFLFHERMQDRAPRRPLSFFLPFSFELDWCLLAETVKSKQSRSILLMYLNVSECIGQTFCGQKKARYIPIRSDTFRYVPIRQCFAKKCKHIKQLKIVVFILKKHHLANFALTFFCSSLIFSWSGWPFMEAKKRCLCFFS